MNTTQYAKNEDGTHAHTLDTYAGFWITALKPEYIEGSDCVRNHYWYIVTCGTNAHTAFRTWDGLNRWLSLTGLKCDIPAFQSGESVRVEGTYRRFTHMKGSSMPTECCRTPILENGEYVQGYKSVGCDGIHELHVTNPNATDKIVLDYWRSVRVCD